MWKGRSGQLWKETGRQNGRISLIPEYRFQESTGGCGGMLLTIADFESLGMVEVPPEPQEPLEQTGDEPTK